MRGFSLAQASAFRRVGVPASVAKSLQTAMSGATLIELARTFSRPGLRALAERHDAQPLSAHHVQLLREAAASNLSTTRAYVSKTRLPLGEVSTLVDYQVQYTVFDAWMRRCAPATDAVSLVDVLCDATILHDVPEQFLCGWVRFAAHHRVPFAGMPGTSQRWSFLGGDTAVMAQAGVSPAEAHHLVAEGRVDHESLAFLAGLRGHRDFSHSGGV